MYRHVFLRSNTMRRIAPIVACLGLALGGAAACSDSNTNSHAGTAGTPAAAASTTATSQAAVAGSAHGGLPSFAPVVKKVEPAVVQVTNEQVQIGQFGQATVPAGVGSGVIYDSAGHVLTNNHVVEGASGLEVSLTDGRVFKATLVGADPQTDLAVLKIDGNNLPVAALGDSSKLEPGDWVVAIGNALALPGGPTVSAGVVSAIGRTVQEPASDGSNSAGPFLFNLIQTSAPINPGNSGGPLINLDGEVVGINTLVAGQAEPGVAAQNIGFSIALATARPIADALVKDGKVAHPLLGVSYTPLTPALAQRLQTTEQHGMVVTQVLTGSPASEAGLQTGDIITKFDGKSLDTESSLAEALNGHKPGDRVSLTISRNGAAKGMQVTLARAQQ
ncbi:MAG: trypsin-like peptidase domain-containing protein [Dehalococcoidia bacterium]|nr:trypsin-like peptidase domain-containing protein [Dehalococcoidia bacterium]